MAQVKEYMKNRRLPYSTQHRIVAYYEFCFQHRYFYEAEILNTLSPHMRQEIGMHVCRKLVENVTFFSNLPLSLLTRIVALLKSEIFLPNDVIVRANQPGDCMYFIASGTVAIYTGSGKEVCHLEDGAHFGEIALVMPDARRVASVVAVEICELYDSSLSHAMGANQENCCRETRENDHIGYTLDYRKNILLKKNIVVITVNLLSRQKILFVCNLVMILKAIY